MTNSSPQTASFTYDALGWRTGKPRGRYGGSYGYWYGGWLHEVTTNFPGRAASGVVWRACFFSFRPWGAVRSNLQAFRDDSRFPHSLAAPPWRVST